MLGLHNGSGRLVSLEELLIDLIEGTKVGNVGQEYIDLDQVVCGRPS